MRAQGEREMSRKRKPKEVRNSLKSLTTIGINVGNGRSDDPSDTSVSIGSGTSGREKATKDSKSLATSGNAEDIKDFRLTSGASLAMLKRSYKGRSANAGETISNSLKSGVVLDKCDGDIAFVQNDAGEEVAQSNVLSSSIIHKSSKDLIEKEAKSVAARASMTTTLINRKAGLDNPVVAKKDEPIIIDGEEVSLESLIEDHKCMSEMTEELERLLFDDEIEAVLDVSGVVKVSVNFKKVIVLESALITIESCFDNVVEPKIGSVSELTFNDKTYKITSLGIKYELLDDVVQVYLIS